MARHLVLLEAQATSSGRFYFNKGLFYNLKTLKAPNKVKSARTFNHSALGC